MRTICCSLAAALLIGSAGCAVNPPAWPDPQSDVAAAMDVADAITIREDGGAVDSAAPAGDQLSMIDAVTQALRQDPGIQIALARVRVAQADGHQARLLPNPVLSIVVRWPTEGGKAVVEAGIAAELASILTRPGRMSAADDRLRGASADVLTAALDLCAQVQTQYVQAQTFDALLPILEERRKLLDRLVDTSRRRLDAGEGIRLDVTTVEAQRVELEVDIMEQQGEARDARLALARLIGRPSDPAAWKLDPWSMPAQIAVDEQAWIHAALEHRPEIRKQMWELSALGADERLTRWALFESSEAGIEAERDGQWSLGPSVSAALPIFDWGQAKRQAARARVLESMHSLTAAKRGAIEDVRRALASFERSHRAWRQAREQLMPLLERRLVEAESVFRGGQSEITPLILAEQDLQAGRAKLVELERKTSQSLIQLNRAVGGAGRAPSAGNQVTSSESKP